MEHKLFVDFKNDVREKFFWTVHHEIWLKLRHKDAVNMSISNSMHDLQHKQLCWDFPYGT